jgi:hypothetical protein
MIYSNNSLNSIELAGGNVSGQDTIGFRNFLQSTGNPNYDLFTGVNWSNNQWVHFVVTYSNSSTLLYVNGVLETQLNGNCSIPIDGNLIIGKHTFFSASSDLSWNGNIDDIGCWNRALTQQEITTLYQSCSNPTATITPQGSTTFCSGGSVNLNASTGNGYTYQWYRNGNIISNAKASSYTATLAGNYTVVVGSNGCSSTSDITSVTVNPNPNVTLTGLNSFTNFYSSPVSLIGSPTGGTYSGSGVIGHSFNPSIAGLGVNTVNYSYTTAAGWSGNASQNTIVYDTLGVVCTTYDTVTTYISVTDTLKQLLTYLRQTM